MTAQFFADTNLFIYAASNDPADARKKRIARRLIETEHIGVSAQVLQEFAAVAYRKPRLGIGAIQTEETVRLLMTFPVVPITAELVLQALELRVRFQLSYWDAAILAAAVELQCEGILSEDFNTAQSYGGIVAVNPFI
jgi:predicted nucleic acid-binding protein